MLRLKGTEVITIPARLDSRNPVLNRKLRIYPSSFVIGTYVDVKVIYWIGLIFIGYV
jgi:hypothetical protein